MVVHESRANIPPHYAREGPPHPETLVNFRIGLASNDKSGLEKALYDISIPGSPLYGKHLNMEEVCVSLGLDYKFNIESLPFR